MAMDLEGLLSEYFRKMNADSRDSMIEKSFAPPPADVAPGEGGDEESDAAMAELEAALADAGADAEPGTEPEEEDDEELMGG